VVNCGDFLLYRSNQGQASLSTCNSCWRPAAINATQC